MATVYKPKGAVRYWVSYNDPTTGKRVRRAAASTRRESEQLLAVWMSGGSPRLPSASSEQVKSVPPRETLAPVNEKSATTLDDLYAVWMAKKAGRPSASADEGRWEWILGYFGGGRALASLRSSEGPEFVAWLHKQAKRRGGGPLSVATVNRTIGLLKAALNHETSLPGSERAITENPFRTLKQAAEHNKRNRICSADELAKIVTSAPTRLALAAMISFETGMSEGELCDLLWSNIDFDTRTVTVHRHKTNRTRKIPFNSDLTLELSRWQLKAPKKDPRVLSINAANFSSQWSRLIERLGIVDLRFHDLRHTAATNMRRAGVDIVTIKEFIGHASWEMVMRYQTVDDDDLRDALRRVKKRAADLKKPTK